MKKYVKSVDSLYGKEPIMAMATINPKLCEQKSIRVEVVQGGEGPSPHVHVYWNNGKVSYVSLIDAAYSDHHDEENTPFRAKQKSEFIEIMSKIWKKYAIELNSLDSNGNPTGDTYFTPATGYEAAVQIWCDTYGGEDKFNYDTDGRPIMPDYNKL